MLAMAVPAPPLDEGSDPVRRVEGSERELVRRAQQGSPEAFEALFALHWTRAHRAAWLVVHDAAAAEDIAQDAFIAALGALDRFDRRRRFGPWLHRIVINRAIDHARSRRLHAVPTDGLPATAPPAPEGWSDELVRALARLPLDQRAAVVMRHALGYTPGEIARALGLPRGTVNSRLRRGLDHLGRLLDDD